MPEESDNGLGTEAESALAELALDLRNAWSHAADPLWSTIEPELWALTHNPWVVLQTASRSKLKALRHNAEFRRRLWDVAEQRLQMLNGPSWFQQTHNASSVSSVAYFSMEFGLSEALPIYSGGLGNVAGDQLKAASDLGIPLVGVGLLYQQGYFRQVIDADGSQRALYPYNDPGQMPVRPVRTPDGEWVRLPVLLPARKLWLRCWEAQVGRLKLYLLDSNDPANPPAYRGITSELYGGGPPLRIVQEMTLGIGGWRLLRALGIKPEVCHLNEGHAAFAILERARSFMEDTGRSFEAALSASRIGNLFTTHTAVDAGFDRFTPELVAHYLTRYAEQQLGIDLKRLLALGRMRPDDSNEPFNMAYLAIRGSGAVNAVSRLHGEVSRRIFHPLFPEWQEQEVPVGHVTNGVHTPTWDSTAADELWTEACGPERWRGGMEAVSEEIRGVPDQALWELRSRNRQELVAFVRERMLVELLQRGENAAVAESIFDANTLTLGFARRFATYKRPNLLLRDQERLVRILTDSERPVQLVIAGKAHPEDQAGQALVQAWVRFIQRPDLRRHVVFLSDYDLLMAEKLVQGTDLWINTPRRPWEACGTSGMKVLVNGGLNLSELDGWWAEAYAPELGWALGDGKEHTDDAAWDIAESAQLYDLLERSIIPEFYERDQNNLPGKWIARIRESMASLTSRFSANRAVRQYAEEYYAPAAIAYRERAFDRGALGVSLEEWEQHLAQHWAGLRFGQLQSETSLEGHRLRVELYLGALRPDSVRVEIYAQSRNEQPPFLGEMISDGTISSEGWRLYTAKVPASRAVSDYRPRIVPFHPAAKIPLESSYILWLG